MDLLGEGVNMFLVWIPVAGRPLGRPRRSCVDNFRMDLRVRGFYRVLLGKTEGKRPLGCPSGRWLANIRMDLWEEGGV